MVQNGCATYGRGLGSSWPGVDPGQGPTAGSCGGGPGVLGEGSAAASRREMPQGSLCLAKNSQQDPSVPRAVPVVPGALTNDISGSGSCQGAAGKWRKGGL